MDQEQKLEGEIQELEHQIDDLEGQYLERTWMDGNIYLGWFKGTLPPPTTNTPKIRLYPK